MPQGHIGRFSMLAERTFARVNLQRQSRSRQPVAKLMCQAGSELAERLEPLVATDLLFVPSELLDHAIDRQRQIAQLVIASWQRHRLEITARDALALLAQPRNWPSELPRPQRCQHQRHQRGHATSDQRRQDRSASRRPPTVFRVQHQQRQRSRGRSPQRHLRRQKAASLNLDQRIARQIGERPGFGNRFEPISHVRIQRQRRRLSLLLSIPDDELGTRQSRELLQDRLLQREVRIRQRRHHARQPIGFLSPCPTAADPRAHAAGERAGQHNHQQHRDKQLSLNRPTHGAPKTIPHAGDIDTNPTELASVETGFCTTLNS